jgi:uncharacterized membrane protein
MSAPHPLVERYLTHLSSNLGRMAAVDREEVVQEIRAHIADATRAGKPLDVVLEALGPADVLARAYNVELLLHPREPVKAAPRAERYLAITALVAIGSIPTLVITVVLGAIGVSFTLAGVAVFVAGLMGVAGTLPWWISMDVPPVFAVAGGPIMASVGVLAIMGLVFYLRLVARTVRKVIPGGRTSFPQN